MLPRISKQYEDTDKYSYWDLTQPKTARKKKNYEFHNVLGKGSFGTVVRATWSNDRKIGRFSNIREQAVAVKIIRKSDKIIKKSKIKAHRQEILDEIEILQKLNHWNIVKCFDWFESRKNFYVTFELAFGDDLFDRLIKQRPFTERQAISVIRSVLEAVRYLHSKNIVHRDLKPDNIMYRTKSKTSDIVIVDFGFARRMDGLKHHDPAGTRRYLAPEVVKLNKFPKEVEEGCKVDIWAIGVIAYRLLCGEYPFKGRGDQEIIKCIENDEPEFDPKYWNSISIHARHFVLSLLRKRQDRRPTADKALKHDWLTSFNPPADQDLSGLRENFHPRAMWRKTIRAVIEAKRKEELAEAAPRTTMVHGGKNTICGACRKLLRRKPPKESEERAAGNVAAENTRVNPGTARRPRRLKKKRR
ncbi:kinase-like domain-containing protein [Phellopilus nigrolimitatus]|nr:kinase-like domain-containing protein [Phellopilus nigrolimitatus]